MNNGYNLGIQAMTNGKDDKIATQDTHNIWESLPPVVSNKVASKPTKPLAKLVIHDQTLVLISGATQPS